MEPDYKKAPDMYVYDCGSIVAARDIPLGGASNWSKADLRVVLQCGNVTWTCLDGVTLSGLKREANFVWFLRSFVQLRWIEVKSLDIFVGRDLLGMNIEDPFKLREHDMTDPTSFCCVSFLSICFDLWNTFSTLVRSVGPKNPHMEHCLGEGPLCMGRSRHDLMGFFRIKSWKINTRGVVQCVQRVVIYQFCFCRHWTNKKSRYLVYLPEYRCCMSVGFVFISTLVFQIPPEWMFGPPNTS